MRFAIIMLTLLLDRGAKDDFRFWGCVGLLATDSHSALSSGVSLYGLAIHCRLQSCGFDFTAIISSLFNDNAR